MVDSDINQVNGQNQILNSDEYADQNGDDFVKASLQNSPGPLEQELYGHEEVTPYCNIFRYPPSRENDD